MDHFISSPKEILTADYSGYFKKYLIFNIEPMFDTSIGRVSRSVFVTCSDKNKTCSLVFLKDIVSYVNEAEFMIGYVEQYGKPNLVENGEYTVYKWMKNEVRTEMIFEKKDGMAKVLIMYYLI